MKKIVHIINPVLVDESSDLFAAQPITFETMRIAQEFARGHVDVALYSAQYPEDRPIIPEWFQMTPDLDRSILDIGSFHAKRKLPLIKDILDRLYDASDAEYFIYTNVDIALMPHFYITINKLFDAGYDAFVINRRTITDDRYQSIEEIPRMYSELGEPHPGHDCFVFKRDVYPRYRIGTVCIGINWVGRALIYNLACHAKNFKEFKRKHLTFHIGNDKIWKRGEYTDYVAHNKSETLRVLAELEEEYGILDKEEILASYLRGAKDIVHYQKKNKCGAKSFSTQLGPPLMQMFGQPPMNPTFLVIGAGKAGTTNLCHLLSQHPEIYIPAIKEPHFFSMDQIYSRGWDWYKSLFDSAAGATVLGEASVTYSVASNFPRAAERIARHLPEARLIYIVRHPIDRIESHWMHQRFEKKGVPRSFLKAVRQCEHLVDASRYWYQLSRYRSYFPDDRILILLLEEMKVDPQAVVSKAFRFLGLRPEFKVSCPRVPVNISAGKIRQGIYLKCADFLLRKFGEKTGLSIPLASSWNSKVTSLLSHRMPHRPTWEKETYVYVRELIADDAQKLLDFAGKPANFWDFRSKLKIT